MATGSPTKLSVPNRKIRNQPANRVHDIEFAAEISTSLISQVRNLQGLLAEREEELRDNKVERARLELEAEGFQQRMKSLDESEHRYKDENWNLETQIHELLAAQKDAADREKKLKQSLNVLQSEKNLTQRELDEVKETLAKQDEKYAAAVKNLEIELGTARRNASILEGERFALQKKMEDLTAQNQELAKAFSVQRGRASEREAGYGMSDEDLDRADDRGTPEHSPPPSPVKGTPRHSMLESETLKTSLHHAQRTLQSLKNNIHREKTEKLELKRMLQEARDELERMRNDPNAAGNRRSRKMDTRESRKPSRLGQLGGARTSKTDLYLEDPNWEDHGDASSHVPRISQGVTPILENSDHFETAQETSDAFETAHERGTETDDFETGAEDLSDDGMATETEGNLSKMAAKKKRQSTIAMSGSRLSYQSTASTSNDDDDDDDDDMVLPVWKTPTSMQSQKLHMHGSRGALNRRSRHVSEQPVLPSSPASFAHSSASGTPQAAGQSLFAELGDMEGSDDESYAGGNTPSRRSVRSVTPGSVARRATSPPPEVPALPRSIMVDSSTMTEPIHVRPEPQDRHATLQSVLGPSGMGSSDHWLPGQSKDGDRLRLAPLVSTGDAGAQHDPDATERLTQFPSPPTSPPRLGLGPGPTPILPPQQELTMSPIHVEHIEPTSDLETPSDPPAFSVSPVVFEHIPPVVLPTPVLSMPVIESQQVEPRAKAEQPLPTLRVIEIMAQQVEPVAESASVLGTHTFSSVASQYCEPRSFEEPSLPSPRQHSFSALRAEEIQPIWEPKHNPPALSPLLRGEAFESGPPSPIRLTYSPIQNVEVEPRRSSPLSTPLLDFSSVNVVAIDPVGTRSPKRNAFIIPRDMDSQLDVELPHTPPFSRIKGKNRTHDEEGPVIAEDETRQSPRQAVTSETPESQRPFGELSVNTSTRASRRAPVLTSDQSSQTALTSDAIDLMLNAKPRSAPLDQKDSSAGSAGTPSTVRIYRHHSRESSFDSPTRGKSKMVDANTDARRPGSAASARGPPLRMPPLPMNHKEVIEAAKSGSSSGGPGTIGTMGPPMLSASAMRNQNMGAYRPQTPSSPKPMSPVSASFSQRAGPTPRGRGTADVQSSHRVRLPSHRSSVSSFASEVDTRFNLLPGMPFESRGFEPTTDYRMIQAITQTMIGEYLWKYTRKTGRGEMSEKRHRRYFWVHPYTRSLYWSDRDPSGADRTELRAKSVPIEAVRVVTDDNPMPPGLHRKSLVVVAPGRSVKFTCTTGQRHEVWFNALSYLLLRTNDEGHNDAEEMAGSITRDDVAEFNPSYSARPVDGVRAAPSLSSYHSRTTRNESPVVDMSMNLPTLTPSKRNAPHSRPTTGTLSRISGYWRDSKMFSGTFGSLRSRGGANNHSSEIYEASQVHDSAEDLREMIEQQNRESSRLENVRACCDGMPCLLILQSRP